jgi:hypothetical protein
MNVNKMLIEKLHPRRFPGTSGKMIAIVGFILGQDWTNPRISEMTITSDGFVMARQQGDVGMNVFVGSAADLDRNLRNLLDAACLLPDEKASVMRLFRTKVQDHRLINEDAEVAR